MENMSPLRSIIISPFGYHKPDLGRAKNKVSIEVFREYCLPPISKKNIDKR
jgi:hypothetical protein